MRINEHRPVRSGALYFLVCPLWAGLVLVVRREGDPTNEQPPLPGARCSLATKEWSSATRAHVPGYRLSSPAGAAAS